MRHFLANVATYTIFVLLLAGAVVFGWLRSSQVVVTRESAVVAAYDPRASDEFVWAELGRGSYLRNCANCHGHSGYADGMIVQRGFPQPVSFHTDRLRSVPTGYVFNVITSSETEVSEAADVSWRATAATALPALVAELEG